MTYFGLDNQQSSDADATTLEGLLGLTAAGRHFSTRRNNDSITSAIPDTADKASMLAGRSVYRNVMNHTDRGGEKYIPYSSELPPVAASNGAAAFSGGTDSTTFLRWSILGDASDKNTPTNPSPTTASNEFDAYWRAVKGQIAHYVTTPSLNPSGLPMCIAWCHEQHTNNAAAITIGPVNSTGIHAASQSTQNGGNGTAAEYASSSRHVSALLNDFTGPGPLRDLGIIKMCHVPTMNQYDFEAGDSGDFAAPYNSKMSVVEPGAAYYDLGGVDHYTHPGDDMVLEWGRVHAWNLAVGKQFLIGEWGSALRNAANDNSASDYAALATHWASSANALESYGTGAGSCYAWNTYIPAFWAGSTAFSGTDFGNPPAGPTPGCIQNVIDNIVTHPYFVFLGDVSVAVSPGIDVVGLMAVA